MRAPLEMARGRGHSPAGARGMRRGSERSSERNHGAGPGAGKGALGLVAGWAAVFELRSVGSGDWLASFIAAVQTSGRGGSNRQETRLWALTQPLDLMRTQLQFGTANHKEFLRRGGIAPPLGSAG